MKDLRLRNAEEMTELVEKIGFLPLFDMGIAGFSVESMTIGQWWTDEESDPWNWRMQAAREGRIVYGKLFRGHAGFVSREWFPRLANFRRDGYDFDSRWEEGLASPKCRDIMNEVLQKETALTCDVKRTVGPKGFEGALSQLENQTYLIIRGFERKINRFGEPYGWHIGLLTMPEAAFGEDWTRSAYDEVPAESFKRILEKIGECFPNADSEALERILK